MQSFTIVAKDDDKEEELRSEVSQAGFEPDDDNPDFVVSYGGDGTLLYSERHYPGVPKVVLRDSDVCFKCHDASLQTVLDNLRSGSYTVEEMMKLRVDGRSALNDVVIRNGDVRRAIRFTVSTDGHETGVVIGDGVVVATPFGSTGYYQSITESSFSHGIGVAFNNPTDSRSPLRLDADDHVTVELRRGEADLAVDNSEQVERIGKGDVVTVEKSDESAKIVTV